MIPALCCNSPAGAALDRVNQTCCWCFKYYKQNGLQCIYYLLRIRGVQATWQMFRCSKAAKISLAQRLWHIRTCAVGCIDGAYVVLLILRNTVLNDCEIKSAIRAVQICELYGPQWDSCFEVEFFLMLIHYQQTVPVILPTIFQSILKAFRLIFYPLDFLHCREV